MWNKHEVKGGSKQIPGVFKDKLRELTSLGRGQVKALSHKSQDYMDVWVRERNEALARQLAANAEIRQRWMESNPIEVRQSQRGYNARAEERVSAEVRTKTLKQQDLGAISDEQKAMERWENEGGLAERCYAIANYLLMGRAHKVARQAQAQI